MQWGAATANKESDEVQFHNSMLSLSALASDANGEQRQRTWPGEVLCFMVPARSNPWLLFDFNCTTPESSRNRIYSGERCSTEAFGGARGWDNIPGERAGENHVPGERWKVMGQFHGPSGRSKCTGSLAKKAPKRLPNHFYECAANNYEDKNENSRKDETSHPLGLIQSFCPKRRRALQQSYHNKIGDQSITNTIPIQQKHGRDDGENKRQKAFQGAIDLLLPRGIRIREQTRQAGNHDSGESQKQPRVVKLNCGGGDECDIDGADQRYGDDFGRLRFFGRRNHWYRAGMDENEFQKEEEIDGNSIHIALFQVHGAVNGIRQPPA